MFGTILRSVIAEKSALRIWAARHRTLEEVLAWAFAHRPPLTIVEVIVQDEFTHDVVLAFRDGAYLVYDTT